MSILWSFNSIMNFIGQNTDETLAAALEAVETIADGCSSKLYSASSGLHLCWPLAACLQV